MLFLHWSRWFLNTRCWPAKCLRILHYQRFHHKYIKLSKIRNNCFIQLATCRIFPCLFKKQRNQNSWKPQLCRRQFLLVVVLKNNKSRQIALFKKVFQVLKIQCIFQYSTEMPTCVNIYLKRKQTVRMTTFVIQSHPS